jgi:hypothetical protein
MPCRRKKARAGVALLKARALKAQGRGPSADLFAALAGEFSFYGQLAAEELGCAAVRGTWLQTRQR